MEINEYIQQLKLEEKAALLQGWSTWTTREVKRLGIPAIFLSDGPTGLRKQAGAGDHLGLNASVPATCFPTSATMANSWDLELGEQLGQALGEEAAANDVHVVLGPGLNMKRSPLCGRNFEYFSEDPYLAGKMAAAYIKGIQSKGPSACPKHFAVNSQELRRMAMDSVVDERTLREIYLTGFEIAVQEGHAQSIMSSYNMVNGEYANENYHLLTEILRNEWGFDGFVVTDWGGDNEHTEGVRAGSNLVMPAPGPGCAIGLVEDVKAGKISEKELDLRVKEFLKVAFERTEAVANARKSFDVDAHHDIARKCAEGSIVLLDNDGILPLKPNASVAVIGDFAQTPRYQGAGSSQVNPTKLDNFLDCAKAAGLKVTGFAKGFSRFDPHPQQELIADAVKLAQSNEIVLLCIGLDEIAESEGMDRLSMELSKGQQALIEAVAKVNKNIVLVISGGSPFVMPDRSTYRAAINGYLGGQAGAGAMVDAIIGKVNPSGKLNETWPEKLEDNPSYPYYPSKERTCEHREGLYIGYRYYDTVNKPVRYPFGYGLSYTSFEYSNIEATKDAVTFTITNTGNMDGAEVVQVYVSCKNGKIFRPRKELKGFAKVNLKAGESKTVLIQLDDKAFRYFNVITDRWEVETADYEIMVASNVSDVKLAQTIHVVGDIAPMPYESLPSYESGKIENVSDSEFGKLLGHPIPDGHWSGELQKNDAICQLYYAKSPVARLAYKVLTSLKEKAEAKGKPDLNILFIYNMPFRAMGKMAGGMVSDKMVDDILFIVNGHFFRGLGRLIVDFFKNLSANSAFVKKLEEQ
ncbi:MAG: glycoside hydrolase family 3 C-terminal domain-containing protein [Oscillospiraceae bacterium]|nr:glycoside hydrolase family 3 C-terminal domain-containing protein [Oscillospiraceae bacterium]